jgi:hypothetical protein
MHDSERLDLPSASTAHRDRRCVGNRNLIRELRRQGLLKEIPQSEDAKSGTRVHAAWAGEHVTLSPQESKTLDDLRRLEAMLLADWSAQESYTILGHELRLWLRDTSDIFELLMSGQLDAAYRTMDWRRVLLLDAKTLYGEVESAEYNDQLRALVALLHFNFPQIKHFRVAIISPNLTPAVSVADYDKPEAELALRFTRLTLADALDPYAPRTPGRYCLGCPAQLNCEEAKQLADTTYNLAKRIEAGEFRLPLGAKGSRILEDIITAQGVLNALKAAYKRELETAGDCLPGWRLKPGKRLRKIPDVEQALEIARENGFETAEFLSCTELSIGKLQNQLAAKSNLTGRALALRFDNVFGELVTIQECAPELERVKTPKLDTSQNETLVQS